MLDSRWVQRKENRLTAMIREREWKVDAVRGVLSRGGLFRGFETLGVTVSRKRKGGGRG